MQHLQGVLYFARRREYDTGGVAMITTLRFFRYRTICHLVLLAFFLVIPSLSHGAEVVLEWDQNLEPDVMGYKIYYGSQSGTYATVIDVGNWTTCVIGGLEPGHTYFIAATVYNAYYESDYSEEITYTTPALNKPPVAAAGADQTVTGGALVTLNGLSSSDPDDGIASYRWYQTNGPAVALANPSSAKTTFAAPDGGSQGAALTFELTVTDSSGLQSTDACVVNVAINKKVSFIIKWFFR